jgi:hypothetical protein
MPIPTWFFDQTWAGKIRSVSYEPLAPEEETLFEEGFSKLVEVLNKMDPDVAMNFKGAKEWYKIACGIFKGRFELPFGGIEPTSGQFGMSFIPAYAFVGANSWLKTVSAGWNNLFGASGSEIAGNSTSGSRRMYAYQDLLSFLPNSYLIALKFVINSYVYPIYECRPFVKLPKPNSYIKTIPIPRKVVIHPEGNHYVRAAFEQAGQAEIVPLGMMIAEHTYLAAEGSFYT